MFTSRWVFSMILAASATLIVAALCTPASTTNSYVLAILSNESSQQPETTFIIFLNVCCLSPGLILSGEYPKKKSSLNFKPDSLSKTGTQSSSVQPG